jgi:hypothetical protein
MKKRYHHSYATDGSYLYSSEKHEIKTDPANWEIKHFYLSSAGAVAIMEYQHRHKGELLKQTFFETIVAGRVYRMTINAVGFSDRSLKMYAANFIKRSIGKDFEKNIAPRLPCPQIEINTVSVDNCSSKFDLFMG